MREVVDLGWEETMESIQGIKFWSNEVSGL
jgi:hypothetical protein